MIKQFATLVCALACVVLASGNVTAQAVPELVTLCGIPAEKWTCSAAQPSGKPAGWYTPSKAITAGKTIYKSCSITQSCAGAICWNNPPTFTARSNHTNDVVLSSGARRAWCGTNSSHDNAYYTFQ